MSNYGRIINMVPRYASDKQKRLMTRLGISFSDATTAACAFQLIDARLAPNRATEKQKAYLRALGVEFDARRLTKQQASHLIETVKAARRTPSLDCTSPEFADHQRRGGGAWDA